MEEYRMRIACFLILSFSIVLLASQGTSNSYMNKLWAGEPPTLDNEQDIKIQDNSDIDNDQEKSPVPSQDSEDNNQTVINLTDQVLNGDGDEVSEDNNQTTSEVPGENASNQNTNQSIETQNQTQNNQEINIQNNIQMKQRLEISEEEGQAPIPLEEQNRIESTDRITETQHRALTGPDCRSGNVLAGASNAGDLRVLSECQDATGTVMHTKKMDDGDYKLFLNLDEKFKFLANEKNNEKTDGFMVVEIVPPDQGTNGVILPKEGDHVHVWGAWVTDKPKGWHEIHPTWKVINE
jgi:hypothetical protein